MEPQSSHTVNGIYDYIMVSISHPPIYISPNQYGTYLLYGTLKLLYITQLVWDISETLIYYPTSMGHIYSMGHWGS